MKPTILPIIAALAAAALPLQAQNLVTNGDFETGGDIFGASPSGWNSTVGAGGTGQFAPGGGPLAPLSGSVAYMGGGTQMFQTFSGVKLQPGTRYTVSFDAYISIGNPTAFLFAEVSYGTGSAGTSGFGGYIHSDLMRGTSGYFGPLNNSGQRFSYTFVTKTLADGFTGSANDIAIYFQPSTGFDGIQAAQLYLDNVTVKAAPVTLAELVTNGDFETGVDPEDGIFGASPTGWNTTVGAAGTGQFVAGGVQPPLNNVVAYMSTGTQMFQTFAGVKLLPDATYYIGFYSYISVGFVDETYPVAYLFSEVSYGTGSAGTSGFGGYLDVNDIAFGDKAAFAALTTTANGHGYSFTTKSIADGFVGDPTKDIAIYFQPSTGFGVNAAQCYIDNVSVVVAVPSEDAGAPVLSITRSGNNVILSWPQDVTGWTLTSSTDVGISDAWDPVPGVSNNSVTVPLNGSKDFFRLEKN